MRWQKRWSGFRLGSRTGGRRVQKLVVLRAKGGKQGYCRFLERWEVVLAWRFKDGAVQYVSMYVLRTPYRHPTPTVP